MSILDNPLDVAFAVSIYTNLDGGNICDTVYSEKHSAIIDGFAF
jgi:hypothetical protein